MAAACRSGRYRYRVWARLADASRIEVLDDKQTAAKLRPFAAVASGRNARSRRYGSIAIAATSADFVSSKGSCAIRIPDAFNMRASLPQVCTASSHSMIGSAALRRYLRFDPDRLSRTQPRRRQTRANTLLATNPMFSEFSFSISSRPTRRNYRSSDP
jgi:hypothetical protein